MDNCFDGATYVLTSLIPISIKTFGSTREQPANKATASQSEIVPTEHEEACIVDHEQPLSSLQYLREILTGLPTSNDFPDNISDAVKQWKAPASRNGRTHFMRWVVINDLNYNGRPRQSALKEWIDSLLGHELTDAQQQDRLSRPMLLFNVIFDTKDGSDKSVDNYLQGLWRCMKPELKHILPCLAGFEPDNACSSFVSLIKRHQIQPAFSWQDYQWQEDSPTKGRLGTAVLSSAAVAVIIVLVAMHWATGQRGWTETLISATIVITSWQWLKQHVQSLINMPYPAPASPFSKEEQVESLQLNHIRKAIFLRDQMVAFLANLQSVSPEKYSERLYAEFGEFIESYKPFDTNDEDLMQPAGQSRRSKKPGPQYHHNHTEMSGQ